MSEYSLREVEEGMLLKRNVQRIILELPRPLVGGIAYEDNDHFRLRDECIQMFCSVMDVAKPKEILEIGTHAGGSACMLLACSGANVTSVDIGTNWIEWDHGYLDWGVKNSDNIGGLKQVVEILTKYFGNSFRFIMGDSTSPETISKFSDRKYDLIFIDGNHDYDFVKKDVQTALNLNIPYLLLDDYNERDETDARIRVAKEFNLIPIKIYQNIHNVSNIGCGFFKNPNYAPS